LAGVHKGRDEILDFAVSVDVDGVSDNAQFGTLQNLEGFDDQFELNTGVAGECT